MKYHIITFGCQMNKADSEKIAAVLEKRGYSSVSKENEADLIVVNMCSVRQSAVDRVFGLIQKLSKLKTNNYKLKTILTGCILKKDKAKFREIFDSIWDKEAWLRNEARPQGQFQSQFIAISSGCNNFCAYCVVPHTRGGLICLSHKKILREVKSAIKNGVKEIWLLGQNVNSYEFEGQNLSLRDISRLPTRGLPKGERETNLKINFAKLLKMVNDIPGDFKLDSPLPTRQIFLTN